MRYVRCRVGGLRCRAKSQRGGQRNTRLILAAEHVNHGSGATGKWPASHPGTQPKCLGPFKTLILNIRSPRSGYTAENGYLRKILIYEKTNIIYNYYTECNERSSIDHYFLQMKRCMESVCDTTVGIKKKLIWNENKREDRNEHLVEIKLFFYYHYYKRASSFNSLPLTISIIFRTSTKPTTNHFSHSAAAVTFICAPSLNAMWHLCKCKHGHICCAPDTTAGIRICGYLHSVYSPRALRLFFVFCSFLTFDSGASARYEHHPNGKQIYNDRSETMQYALCIVYTHEWKVNAFCLKITTQHTYEWTMNTMWLRIVFECVWNNNMLWIICNMSFILGSPCWVRVVSNAAASQPFYVVSIDMLRCR